MTHDLSRALAGLRARPSREVGCSQRVEIGGNVGREEKGSLPFLDGRQEAAGNEPAIEGCPTRAENRQRLVDAVPGSQESVFVGVHSFSIQSRRVMAHDAERLGTQEPMYSSPMENASNGRLRFTVTAV